MLRTITGTDDRGFPATVTLDVNEPTLPDPEVLPLYPPTRFGVTVDPTQIETRLPWYPGARLCRVFGYPGDGIPPWQPAPRPSKPTEIDRRLERIAAVAPEITPHVSFKDWPDDARVAAMVHGWLDDLPIAEDDAVSTGVPAYLTWMHEPEPKGVDPALYRRRWFTLAKIVDDHVNGGHVPLVPVQTLQWTMSTGDGKGKGDLSIYYTGIGSPGIDCYADSWRPDYPPPGQFLAPALRLAAAAGVAPFLPELGSAKVATDTSGERRADWIRAVGSILRAEGAEAASWWDDFGTGGVDIRLDEPGRAAWNDVIEGRA